MSKITRGLIIFIVIIGVVFLGAFVYLEFFSGEESIPDEEDDKVLIDEVSPYTNQGLHVEILRIRNRVLMDKMLVYGLSWREAPRFYYIVFVDGKEGNVKDCIGFNGVYEMWDSFGLESVNSFSVPEEAKKSQVRIVIMEERQKGVLGRLTEDVALEEIVLTYDYRTGRWQGDDSFRDSDGYGHYRGEKYEVWFNIYQSDFDHDGIPYWIEVNVLGTDPTIDDSKLDPDGDGIPTSWEWKWGYDPFTWDDHANLDPDIDGIENSEEYHLRKWFSNPFQPDIYLETDGMEKKGLFDVQHIFFEEAQQMLIERFAQYGITVYIDDGWPDGPKNGGGEMLPFTDYIDDRIGKQVLGFYTHHFADERKGVFRYVIIGNAYSGFISPSKYISFDTVHVGMNLKDQLFTRVAVTPRFIRVSQAKAVMHELGHSFGLIPITFPGNDIISRWQSDRYPSMSDEDYNGYLNEYYSLMNYQYIYNKPYFYSDETHTTLFDYSDGSNGPPYDQNDWEHVYLPSFQIDVCTYEEPETENFEDFTIVDDYPGVILEGWDYDEELTERHEEYLKDLAIVKTTDVKVQVFRKTGQEQKKTSVIKIFARPIVAPVHAVWSLIAEGEINNNGIIYIYSQEDIIQEKYPK